MGMFSFLNFWDDDKPGPAAKKPALQRSVPSPATGTTRGGAAPTGPAPQPQSLQDLGWLGDRLYDIKVLFSKNETAQAPVRDRGELERERNAEMARPGNDFNDFFSKNEKAPPVAPTAAPSPTKTPTPAPVRDRRELERERNAEMARPTTPLPSRSGAGTGILDVNEKTDGSTPVRAEVAAAFQASDPVRQTLLKSGWKIDDNRPAAVNSEAGLDMTKVRELSGYNYTLTPEEGEAAQAAYTGAKGYTPGKNRIDPKRLPTISSSVTRSAPMTWEAYNALTDDQRRAVDFNGLLVEARERDVRNQGPQMEEADYRPVQNKVFGEGGRGRVKGSNTLNLLDKMGIVAQGQDLDEFLSLDRAITMDELKDFKLTNQKPVEYEQRTMGILEGMNSPTQLKTNFAESRGLVNLSKFDASVIQRAGEFIAGAQKNPEGAPWDRNAANMAAISGERPTPDKIPFGWALSPDERTDDLDKRKEEFFQKSYQHLQNKGNADTGWIWEGMKTYNYDDIDKQELFDYFDQRSRWEESTGTLDPNLRTGADLRQFAGIGA